MKESPGTGSALRLSLLDAFALAGEEGAIEAPMTAQRLLAFLALHDRPLLRTYVAGTLWRDVPDERAHASLRSALWRARRIGRRVVEVDRGRLSLSADVVVDVREMTALARAALRGRAGTDEDVETAARLTACRGELLPDWYDDWVELERERTHQLRLHALETLSGRLADAGRFGAASDAALAAIGVDRLRESAHRALINVHLAEGNVAEALRQYRFFSRLSIEELGLPPSARMEQLIDRIGGDVPVTVP